MRTIILCTSFAMPLTSQSVEENTTQQVFHHLYLNHHRWLSNWLSNKLACSHQAADFAQDTFIRLLTFSGISDIKEPRAFLTTTASRIIIDDARRKTLEKNYLERYYFYHGEQACTPSEESLLVITQSLTVIVNMLDALPEKCQQAFLMSRFDGLPHSEIAEQLGVSKSMIKKYMTQAMLHCYQLVHKDELFSLLNKS
jgi:RNA polymerase sigma-70 factor (ECF subfamily)